jgi:FkbM family methyltransferase
VHWREHLDRGMTLSQVIEGIATSDEALQRSGNLLAKAGAQISLPLDAGGRFDEPVWLRAPASDRSLVPTLLARGGVWEPHLTDFLGAVLQFGHWFLDGGANLGYFSVIAGRLVGPRGRVLAMEPGEYVGTFLRSTVELNGMPWIDVYPYALWDTSIAKSLAVLKSAPATGRLTDGEAQQDGVDVADVACVALDELIGQGDLVLERLDVVKLDVEGAETAALRGMRQAIARHRPVICLEFNPGQLESLGSSPAAFWAEVTDLGYRIALLPQDEQQWLAMSDSERIEISGVPVIALGSLEEILDSTLWSWGTVLDLVAVPA